MRTTIIPAQITTVEDKIAGSLSMTQILILMFPVLWTALVYIILYPTIKLVPYKLGLITAVSLICITLSIRVKDKIVADWLGVLIRYTNRPKYWLFNKNDITSRTIDVLEIPNTVKETRKTANAQNQEQSLDIKIADLIKLEKLIESGKVAIRYQFENKRA